MGDPEPDRLDSWKQIADHLGREVRTAIRWERERGLPVHRVPGGQRGAVFAYRSEIDAWLRSREPIAPAPASPAPTPAPLPGERPPAPGRALRLPVAALLLFLAIVAGAAWLLRPRGSAPVPPAVRIDSVDFGPHELVARDHDGRVAWRHVFEQDINTSVLSALTSQWYSIADLDGDGRLEVVASVPLEPEASAGRVTNTRPSRDELLCFSSTGEVLWHTRLDDRAEFRGGTFEPPWLAGHVAAYRAKAGIRIAWAQVHHTWWPSFLLVFDARGNRLSTFLHAGSIRALRAVESEGRVHLLAGGVSNSYRAAFLAVLDGDSVTGHGPVPPGSPFECLGCTEALPLRYFLFPPSDISAASGLPYNTLKDVIPYGDGLEAFTIENGSSTEIAEMNFRFSRDFRLLDARSSDSFRAHESYERAGKLDHGVDRCPWYLKPPPVREWDAVNGWRDLTPTREAPFPSPAATR
jgi:hypothetical protein